MVRGDDRIWLTGAGLYTALGRDVETTWRRLLAGDRGLSRIELFDVAGQKASLAAEVKGVVLPDDSGRWSRSSALALGAATEALAAAGLDPRGARVGLVVGTTTGGMFETEARLAKLAAEPQSLEGQKALQEMLSHPLSSVGDCLFDAIGPFARVRTVCSACSSGANAFALGAEWLLEGDLDAVLVGGTDGLCRLTLSGFNALAAVDPEACRPFDRRRKGLNLGEGAGFAVLERATRARARGKDPVAELAGWALGAEAHHITNPEATGTAAAAILGAALSRARLSPAEIDYVNAHGTGTPLNDPMETAALRRALGPEIARIPVSSSKGQLGHTLGAAGAIEAVLTALAVRDAALPPTAGLEQVDAACDLVHVLGEGRRVGGVRAALSNSFGFGGMGSVLVLARPGLGPEHASAGRTVVVTGAATLGPGGVLGAVEGARLLSSERRRSEPPAELRAGPLDLDLATLLDATRARRLDRPARLGAVVAQRALAEAGDAAKASPERAGVVLGSAFGSVDASAAFMHRVFEKGPRFASPAEFPNLVPSSPVGHVSIYLGLRGASLSTADLGTSGESAFAVGLDLVSRGEADVVVAGAVEEASDIAERILAGLFARTPTEVGRPRSEGAAALVLEEEASARARGARILARVVATREWRTSAPAWEELPAPREPSAARVVLGRGAHEARAALDRSPWARVERASVTRGMGHHEGLGAVALAAAAGLVAEGGAREVLVIGVARGRGFAVVLASP